jgi:hypothetical protein
MMQAWSDYLEQLKVEIPEAKPMRTARGMTKFAGVREAAVGEREAIAVLPKHA